MVLKKKNKEFYLQNVYSFVIELTKQSISYCNNYAKQKSTIEILLNIEI